MLWTTVLACFGGQALAASVLKRDFWGLDPNAGHWVRHDDQPERYEDYKRDPEGALCKCRSIPLDEPGFITVSS